MLRRQISPPKNLMYQGIPCPRFPQIKSDPMRHPFVPDLGSRVSSNSSCSRWFIDVRGSLGSVVFLAKIGNMLTYLFHRLPTASFLSMIKNLKLRWYVVCICTIKLLGPSNYQLLSIISHLQQRRLLPPPLPLLVELLGIGSHAGVVEGCCFMVISLYIFCWSRIPN